MKVAILLAVFLAASMFAPSILAADGKLRKCSFHEIMNEEDDDGLVQGSAGENVCFYLHKDASEHTVQTKPGVVSRSPRKTAIPGESIDAERRPDESKAKSTMQKARHDAMQLGPQEKASEVEVRGWDPGKKDANSSLN